MANFVGIIKADMNPPTTFSLLNWGSTVLAGEKSDPDIYANNVAALISKETGIPLASEGVSAIDYLEEIQKAREGGACAELATTGWKKLFSCRSERQSPRKAN